MAALFLAQATNTELTLWQQLGIISILLLTSKGAAGVTGDGGGGIQGFSDDTEAPNVTIELVRRGYSEAQIRKTWGENLLRVWRDVEKVAGRMKQEK